MTGLINNAGFGAFGPFHSEDPERLREEIGVDVGGVVDVSRAFVGRLRSAGAGVLINVASMAAYQPIPNMAVYAATKAFVLSFTEALWQESLGTEEATSGAAFQTSRQVVETVLLKALATRTID